MHLQVTFEFDLTLYRIDRDVYSILDWVGDVGGLNEGLFLILKVFLIAMQFNDFQHFLIQHLYRRPDPMVNPRTGVSIDNGRVETGLEYLDDKKTSWLRQKFISCCPIHCIRLSSCCRLNREERLFVKAREKYEEEVDIIDFLKRIRHIETV